jgi:regulator of sigma E protease
MLGTIFSTIISFVFVFGILVFVHELGHFIAAKIVGVRVERFYLGFDFFGLRILRFTRGNTEYGIGVIPLGGYVKMAGFVDESLDTKTTGAPDEFMSKNTFQKLFVISAGVTMNLIMGFIIYTVVALSMQIADQPEAVDAQKLPAIASQVTDGMPAQSAGMVDGARIIKIGDQTVTTWQNLTDIIRSSPGKPLEFVWEQGDSSITKSITPIETWDLEGWKLSKIGLIGIAPVLTNTTIGPLRNPNIFEAIEYGYSQTHYALRMVFASVRGLIIAQIPIRDMAGPLGIARISGTSGQQVMAAVKEGRGVSEAAGQLFSLIAFFSITLAFINILPIPALDGGHFALIIIEGIRRKPLSLNVKLAIQWVGIVLILGLFIILTYNDIFRKYP